jgi:hypothetical protein
LQSRTGADHLLIGAFVTDDNENARSSVVIEHLALMVSAFVWKYCLASVALVGFVVSCDRNGVISANFRLSEDSPLPSWVILPSGITRDEVSVTITTYEATTTPSWKEKFKVRDKRNGRIIQQAMGTGYWHPDSEREKAPAATYPNWVIIEVNGQKDVYQQSGSNDFLKIVKK